MEIQENSTNRTTGKNGKRGSALVIAIVVMMVVMMLSLALLLVSFSLFSAANKQQSTEQCKEIAHGVSRELEREITGKEVNFITAEEMEAAMNAGEAPLWSYLRCNLWQDNWPYYNREETGHSASCAYRYFNLQSDGGADAEILDGVSVKMYWESSRDADKAEQTSFVIQVTCEKWKQKSTITTYYDLAIEDGISGYGSGSEQKPDGVCNPGHNTIHTGEKWTFHVTKRE